jgi:membrane protease subunit (stomatin/prohibitin family)
MTPEQQELDAKLWWTTVRPWLARIENSWPTQPHTTQEAAMNQKNGWTCPNCGLRNAPSIPSCANCGTLRPPKR